jgi:hypothetical protein
MQEMLTRVTRPLSEVASRAWVRVVAPGRDRGDVPGWVLVTIMTAGLVTALWLVADDKLRQLFGDALDGVVGGAP